MWTPRRIVMLTGCFVLFFVGYLTYAASAIGHMDGLPPLPEIYWPVNAGGPVVQHVTGPTPLTQKIKMAFGPECIELKRAIRLDLKSRSMVLCAEQFLCTDDGRVSLAPISVAVFGKARADGGPVEISTISGDTAWLTFDRPVKNFSEIGSRKIVEAEIQGRIEIRNNRRKVERDEDLHVSIANGPLYYREANHLIWTHDHVKLTDYKSKPRPHVITGKGMQMELHSEQANAGKPAPRKAQKEAISGVNWVVLQSNVEMQLYIDGKNGLISNHSAPAKAAPAHEGPDSDPDKRVRQDRNPDPRQAPERASLHISTPGLFRYDILEKHDVANFDVTSPGPAQPLRNPQHVDVIRKNETTGAVDHLVCQHLTLHLRRKESGAVEKAPPQEEKPAGEGAEIETVHATGANRVVVLTSDSEKLIARGNDFFHDTTKGITILKGEPELEVDKEENKIFARELYIQDVKPAGPVLPGQPLPKPYQNIWAKGPGRIHMVEKKPVGPEADGLSSPRSGKPVGPKTTHAFWDTLLTSTKDNGEDLLVLTGNARFVDESTGQTLKGDQLKVWLEAADKNQSTPAADTTSGRRPQHLEATGNVVARSHEINIHDSSRLVVWFKDVPAQTHLPPGGALPAKPAPGAAKNAAPAPGDRRPTAGTIPGKTEAPWEQSESVTPHTPQPLPRGSQTPAQTTSQTLQGSTGPELPEPDNSPPPRPFDLKARSIEAKVLRSPIKSTIDELWCESAVEVHQDPAQTGETGTDVKGETLKMTARGYDTYYLVVTGDLGELKTDKIYIIGPEINIDQSTNKAWVYGDGAMRMESGTNFQGDKLDQPVPLTVHWHKSMLFNGSSAEFHGNIQGEQEKARLACQRLHVFFDRTVSLKDGNKKDDPAKVKSLVCDREVHIEDSTYESDKLVKWTKLFSPGVQMDALEADDLPPGVQPAPGKQAGKLSGGNLIYASGPGNVRIWELGDADGGPVIGGGKPTTSAKPAAPAGGKPGGKEPREQEMKLTYVEFGARMDANSKNNTALFWGGREGIVRVLNLPANKPDIVINLDAMLTSDLPAKAMFMRCKRLKVLDHPSEGKPNKQMEAYGEVFTQTREFYAYADKVTYNQQKEQVIFYGENGYATMYKQTMHGGKPDVLEGKKIIHNRLTGNTQVIDARSAGGVSTPGAR